MKMEEIVQQKLRSFFNDDSIIFDKSRFAGGLTNYNYIMSIHGTEYVVREPGGMTNKIIDRKIEKVNNAIASKMGVNSECVFFDETSGTKISVYLKNSKNIALMNPNSLVNLKSVSRLLKKIHSSSDHFPNIFDLHAELAKYEEIVKELNGSLFFDYQHYKEQFLTFIQLNLKNEIFVPCHNDTVPENFLIDDKERVYLVDWEYSGMNDPSWDVAAYILESRLSEESIRYFVEDYYGKPPGTLELQKIKSYMLAQDLLWTVWALIRHYNGDDFRDYCYFRYDRFRENIKLLTESPDYSIADMVKS